MFFNFFLKKFKFLLLTVKKNATPNEIFQVVIKKETVYGHDCGE